MPLSACAPEVIEANIEPFIYFCVDLMIVITHFLWCLLLL